MNSILSVLNEIMVQNTESISSLNLKLDGKLDNDYNGSANIGKGIKFGKNADGSFFTLRPYLPSNIMQITKNDNTSLFSVDTSGNVEALGNIVAKGVKLSGIYISHIGKFGRTLTETFNLPCTNDHVIAFMCNGTNMFGTSHIKEISIGSNNSQVWITRDSIDSFINSDIWCVYWI